MFAHTVLALRSLIARNDSSHGGCAASIQKLEQTVSQLQQEVRGKLETIETKAASIDLRLQSLRQDFNEAVYLMKDPGSTRRAVYRMDSIREPLSELEATSHRLTSAVANIIPGGYEVKLTPQKPRRLRE